MRALFTLTIFVGSFLLFLVEPMVAKMILPTFGGSPQVWNASVLFFQIALLLGYLYAHWAPRRFGSRLPYLHAGFLTLAALVLPFSVHGPFFQWVQGVIAGSRVAESSSAVWVLISLAGLVGLPFLILSSGASLLQHWFSFTRDPRAKDPYFLYSASNLGSLLGLFAYPFLLEPRLTLPQQARVWSLGYGVLIGLMFTCALAIRKYSPRTVPTEEPKNRRPEVGDRKSIFLWTALAAVPSSLMLGVTTYLTSNVAPVPLLWVVPLALYLVTFILAFSRWGAKPLPTLARMIPLLVTPLAIAIILDANQPIFFLGFLHLAIFFACAWMCHSRLSSLRPDPSRLTEYYFYIALGGAIGGAFNSLVAPVAFNGFYEYPIALVAVCLLRPRKEGEKPVMLDWVYAVAVCVLAIVLMAAMKGKAASTVAEGLGWSVGTLSNIVGIGVPLVLAFVAVDRRLRFGLALGAVFVAAFLVHPTATSERLLLSKRSFFGIHRVSTDGRFHTLSHGTTIHGKQDSRHPEIPLTYYYPNGPIGQIFSLRSKDLHDIALVGLGVGSIAAYGEPWMRMTYFEIDPVVEKIALEPSYFTFLRDSKAKLDVVLGDARLTLSRTNRKYDLIVLDAFSSDTIPVHLLTKEAMAMYLDHLKPDGVLAFHISNSYLELQDTLSVTGAQLGLANEFQVDPALPEEEEAGKKTSCWIAFSKSKSMLQAIAMTNSQWGENMPEGPVRPWTDDFSNVLSLFRPES